VDSRSLFLSVIGFAEYSENACAAGVFRILGGRLAVFFENHPDIGPNIRETGSQLTASTASKSLILR
jgi:hypothetical protein